MIRLVYPGAGPWACLLCPEAVATLRWSRGCPSHVTTIVRIPAGREPGEHGVGAVEPQSDCRVPRFRKAGGSLPTQSGDPRRRWSLIPGPRPLDPTLTCVRQMEFTLIICHMEGILKSKARTRSHMHVCAGWRLPSRAQGPDTRAPGPQAGALLLPLPG